MRFISLVQIFLVFSWQVLAEETPLPLAGKGTRVYVAIMGPDVASHIFVVLKDSDQICRLDRWDWDAVCLPSEHNLNWFPSSLTFAEKSGKAFSFEVNKSMVEILEAYSKLHHPIWADVFRPLQLAFDNCANEVRRIVKYLFSARDWARAGGLDWPIALPQVVFRKAKALATLEVGLQTDSSQKKSSLL